LAPDVWRSGERRTIGQLIAMGRTDETESAECRRALLSNGMRLEKHENETWTQAWLAVANKHPGLDKLLTGYSAYQGPKRSQVLGQLRRVVQGVEHKAQRSTTPLRFAGVQSRYLLVPPLFLPSLEEE
jgi:hypothetical protein